MAEVSRATAPNEPLTSSAADELEADALRDLGGAVRARRHQLGFKLSDMAAGTGLSVPFLSQVETSFATPSLTSLFAIARYLDTTPERLLAGPGPAAVVLTRQDEGRRYLVTDDQRSASRRQITGLGEPFSVAEYTIEPGERLGGFHASRGRELLYVTAGRLLVDIDGGDGPVTHELAAGDSLVYPTSVHHRWRHTGRSTTRFVHVVSAG
ncbi:MAG: XRE family transcriptional regulator [Ilumatobacteraceae bacterium]